MLLGKKRKSSHFHPLYPFQETKLILSCQQYRIYIWGLFLFFFPIFNSSFSLKYSQYYTVSRQTTYSLCRPNKLGPHRFCEF